MGETKTAFGAERGKCILKFDPDEVVLELDPTKPLYQRRGADPADPDMVATIKSKGVIEPIVVVKGEDGRPYVAAGARRTVASRQANRELKKDGLPTKLIPAVYRDEKGAEGIALKIIENALRKDLPISAKAEEARLALSSGYSEAQVAEWFGVSPSTVRNWAKVPHLHASVQRALDAGSVRLVDAIIEIADLPKAEQPAALSRIEAARPTRAARKAAGTKVKRKVTPLARLRRLEEFVDNDSARVPAEVVVVLDWLTGDASDDALTSRFPALAVMFEVKAKKQKAVK